MADDFDDLRQKSIRGAAFHEEVDGVEGSGGLLGQFTAGQRLMLALLVLGNIVVIGLLLFSVLGVF